MSSLVGSRISRVLPFLILTAGLVLAGCDTRSVPRGNAGREEPIRWTPGSEPVLEVGVVAGEEPYQFDRVRDAELLPDGRLAVADDGSHQIRIFDAEGRFLVASGEEGDGPGQWRRFGQLESLGGDTLAVYDSGLRRTGFVAAGDGAWLGTADSARVQELITPSAFHAGLLIEGVHQAELGTLAPVLDQVSAFDTSRPFRLEVHPDGRVYVLPTPSSGSRSVRIFGLDGRHRGTLEIPTRFSPLKITPRRMIGVRRDSLDVEFVQVWELEGATSYEGPTLAEAMAARGDAVLPDVSVPPSNVSWSQDVWRSVATNQEMHYAEFLTYTVDLERLRETGRPMEPPEGVEVQILGADEGGWMGRSLEREARVGCFLAYGRGLLPEGVRPGRLACWRG